MSDTAPYTSFGDYLRDAVGVDSPPCPICADTRWGRGADLALWSIDRRGDPDEPGVHGSIHATSISCQRCGYMMLFDYEVVDRRRTDR